MADPWVVTPGERTKHEEQFNTIRPANGFITGDQAKGFFLQSRLPPPVLGIIWYVFGNLVVDMFQDMSITASSCLFYIIIVRMYKKILLA